MLNTCGSVQNLGWKHHRFFFFLKKISFCDKNVKDFLMCFVDFSRSLFEKKIFSENMKLEINWISGDMLEISGVCWAFSDGVLLLGVDMHRNMHTELK